MPTATKTTRRLSRYVYVLGGATLDRYFEHQRFNGHSNTLCESSLEKRIIVTQRPASCYLIIPCWKCSEMGDEIWNRAYPTSTTSKPRLPS